MYNILNLIINNDMILLYVSLMGIVSILGIGQLTGQLIMNIIYKIIK